MTALRTLLAIAAATAIVLAIALPTHAVIKPPQSLHDDGAPALLLRKDLPPAMNIQNQAARVVSLNLGAHGVVSVPPLKAVDLIGDQATAAKAALDGPMKALIDDGTLVIDGAAKAPPPAAGPVSGGSTNMGDARLAPTAADMQRSDTEPPADTPSSGSAAASKRK